MSLKPSKELKARVSSVDMTALSLHGDVSSKPNNPSHPEDHELGRHEESATNPDTTEHATAAEGGSEGLSTAKSLPNDDIAAEIRWNQLKKDLENTLKRFKKEKRLAEKDVAKAVKNISSIIDKQEGLGRDEEDATGRIRYAEAKGDTKARLEAHSKMRKVTRLKREAEEELKGYREDMEAAMLRADDAKQKQEKAERDLASLE